MISQYTKYFTKEDLNLQSKKKKKITNFNKIQYLFQTRTFKLFNLQLKNH